MNGICLLYTSSAIESAVKRHTILPSFFSSTADAGAYELKWDGQQYSLTLTDTNGVLGDYTFTSNITGLNFSVDGNQLTITSSQAIKGSVTVKAEKISAQRSGVVVWTDGITGGGKQDLDVYKRQAAYLADGSCAEAVREELLESTRTALVTLMPEPARDCLLYTSSQNETHISTISCRVMVMPRFGR